ncbi:MAG: hypothetical protein E4H01_10200 [Lysobacterales bacterium]|nr:MAG: hypothetical protein E4H01_10200 [Xanthomonadales bacterium]
MSVTQNVLAEVINASKPPAHQREKSLTEADTDLEILKSYAFKNRKTLEEVLTQYLEFSSDAFDDLDKKVATMREQAKIGLDVMKAVTRKDIDHKIELQVTAIERRIIDP